MTPTSCPAIFLVVVDCRISTRGLDSDRSLYELQDAYVSYPYIEVPCTSQFYIGTVTSPQQYMVWLEAPRFLLFITVHLGLLQILRANVLMT